MEFTYPPSKATSEFPFGGVLQKSQKVTRFPQLQTFGHLYLSYISMNNNSGYYVMGDVHLWNGSLWGILLGCQLTFQSYSKTESIELICSGTTLEIPEHLPESVKYMIMLILQLKEIMKRCWEKLPKNRPKFNEIEKIVVNSMSEVVRNSKMNRKQYMSCQKFADVQSQYEDEELYNQ